MLSRQVLWLFAVITAGILSLLLSLLGWIGFGFGGHLVSLWFFLAAPVFAIAYWSFRAATLLTWSLLAGDLITFWLKNPISLYDLPKADYLLFAFAFLVQVATIFRPIPTDSRQSL